VPSIQGRVKELLKPEIYGAGVKKVRLIQTHTSWVFIAGEFAYKVKKPVNFGFLDYTTLQARRFFCKEEFRLNRKLSPELYIGVLPVVDRSGKIRFGGKGRVIDYCIKMRAMPQSAIMTEKLKKGRVDYLTIDELARIVAQFHRQAETGKEIARYGSIKTVKFNWEENFIQTREFIGRTINEDQFYTIKRAIERFIFTNRRLFLTRQRAGFIKRCHGDLHPRNIFLKDKIYIFDCLEFNPRFFCSDTAAEIAFMAMDLDFHNRHDLANFFIERYLIYSDDPGILPLLNFYRCYRAYVRGKVTSFLLNDPNVSSVAKANVRCDARRYFHLAFRYARFLDRKPYLMVVFGLPGVGKTYLARRLAEKHLAMHLLSDSIRKQLCNVPVTEHRFEGYGKGLYASGVSQRTYAEMFNRAEMFLRGRISVILDATFTSEESRERCRQLAKKLNVPLLFIWVTCPEKTVVSRLRRRANRAGFSDANLTIYRIMKEKFIPPAPAPDLIQIDSRQKTERLLIQIEKRLNRLLLET